MPDQQYDNEYVRRYKETDDDVECVAPKEALRHSSHALLIAIH